MAFQSNFGPTLRGLLEQDAIQQGQLREQQQQGQLRQLQMQKAQEDMQQQGQLRDLLPQIMGSGDPQSMLQKLMATGNPQAMAMAGQLAPVMTAMQRDTKPVVVGRSLMKPDGTVIGTDSTWSDEQKAGRDAKMQELQVRMQDSATSRADRLALQREMMNMRKQVASQGSNPYFTPIQTAQGVMAFNARTGRVEPVSINGESIVGSSSDPRLQGRIATSKKEGMEIGEQRALIVGKQNSLESVKKAKLILDGGIYSGAWGPLTKETMKRLPLTDKTKAARTESFISEIGNIVIPRLKEFGGNDSNEELKYLQKVMGGDVTMEPAALKSVLESAEIKIQRGIDRLNIDGRSRLDGNAPPTVPKNTQTSAAQGLPAGWSVQETK